MEGGRVGLGTEGGGEGVILLRASQKVGEKVI